MSASARAISGAPVRERAIGRLIRLEVFKLQRRPMSGILLAVLVAISVGVPLLFFGTLQIANTGGAGQMQDADRRVLLDRLVFPGVLHGSVENVVSFGVPLLIILTATAFGGEYTWGTIRLLLARGETRGEYVISKFSAIALWWFVALMAGAAAGIGIGAVLGMFDDPRATITLSGGDLAGLAARLLGAWFGALVYIAMTASLATQFRSTAVGVGVGLITFYGERIIGGVTLGFGVEALDWLVKCGVNYNLRVVIGGEGVHNPVWFAVGVLTIYLVTALYGTRRLLRAKDVVATQAG